MQIHNTTQRFGVVTKLFHWLNVLLIISMLTVGFIMTGLENSPDKFKLYGLHKSGGITVLVLATLWIIWRNITAKPALPDTLSRAQKLAATGAKYALFTFMIAMPLTGWGMSSAAGFPVSVFGWFTLPNLVEVNKPFAGDLRELHELIAKLLMATIALHALAGLLHHFYFKDNTLKRMLPFGERKKKND
jgi:cytochrome b561